MTSVVPAKSGIALRMFQRALRVIWYVPSAAAPKARTAHTYNQDPPPTAAPAAASAPPTAIKPVRHQTRPRLP
ncbi:hypothetical protein [Kitasatospora sp. NPDC088346]|uniref:hypothetical protein n=1 Tax=Kitasatospora sp. NPDC088346 TaxID=3364073 RepID=UPI0038146DE3